jgi:hypothetical protein
MPKKRKAECGKREAINRKERTDFHANSENAAELVHLSVGMLFDAYLLEHSFANPSRATVKKVMDVAATLALSAVYAHALELCDEDPREVLENALDDTERLLDAGLKEYEKRKREEKSKCKRSGTSVLQ